jgi:photosystem II stability/assembly factor-like uncharacterized protein
MRILISTLLTVIVLGFAPVSAQTWASIGPTGDLGTATLNDHTNGRIRSIHVQAIGNEHYIYVGASSGGVWRAKGTGPVWTSLGDRLPNPAVGALAVHPNNPDDILVGTGDYRRYPGSGMFRTTDAGQNWTAVSLPAAVRPQNFFQIFYLPTNPNIVLAASDAGLLRSTTGPNGTWALVLDGVVSDLLIHPTNPNIQYSCRATTNGTGGGVYRSDDAGATWTLITGLGAPVDQFGIARIALCRGTPDTIVFVYEWNCVIKGIRKSTNGGITWTSIEGPLLNLGNGQACHAMAIAIRPDNSNVIFVAANSLWKSDNGGQDWSTVPKTINIHDDYLRLYFSPVTGDGVLWMCNDGGVYRYAMDQSLASTPWNGNNQTGLRVSQVVAMDARLDYRVIGLQDNGAAASNDGGRTWTISGCCDVYAVAITDDLSPTFWYVNEKAFSAVPNVVKQPFGGSLQLVGDPVTALDNALFYDRFTRKVYGLAVGSLISRPDSASSPGIWPHEIGLGGGGLRGSYINGDILYVWNSSPGVLLVLQAINGSWRIQRSVGIGIISNTTYNIRAVFASTDLFGQCWALVQAQDLSFRILYTADAWQSWTNIPAPSHVGQVWDLVVRPFQPKEIYLATDNGVLTTQNGGFNWQPIQTGLPAVQCRVLRYRVDPTFRGQDKLIVATFGRGLYERLVPGPAIVYVDLRNTGAEFGTLEHPFNTFDEGLNATPVGGILALRGDMYVPPTPLSKRLTIHAYETAVQLRR